MISEREYLEELVSLASQQADKESNKLRLQIEALEQQHCLSVEGVDKKLTDFVVTQDTKDDKRWLWFKWVVGIAVIGFSTVSFIADLRLDGRQDTMDIFCTRLRGVKNLYYQRLLVRMSFEQSWQNNLERLRKIARPRLGKR